MPNPGQELFYHFFMERVIPGKEEEASALLTAGFEKQAAGTFDAVYFKEVMQKSVALIRSECVDELKQAMAHFGGSLT